MGASVCLYEGHLLEVVVVLSDIRVPLTWHRVFVEDSRHRAYRLTGPAVNAFRGIYIIHFVAVAAMDTVYGAHIHAASVFDSDTRLCDDIRHCLPRYPSHAVIGRAPSRTISHFILGVAHESVKRYCLIYKIKTLGCQAGGSRTPSAQPSPGECTNKPFASLWGLGNPTMGWYSPFDDFLRSTVYPYGKRSMEGTRFQQGIPPPGIGRAPAPLIAAGADAGFRGRFHVAPTVIWIAPCDGEGKAADLRVHVGGDCPGSEEDGEQDRDYKHGKERHRYAFDSSFRQHPSFMLPGFESIINPESTDGQGWTA